MSCYIPTLLPVTTVFLVLEKIGFIFVLIASGITLRGLGIITDEGKKSLSGILVNFFWPALIIFSITQRLDAGKVLAAWPLPVLALFTSLTGLVTGIAVSRLFKFSRDEKTIFLYHSLINNFVFMALPFVIAFVPKEGTGLLFIHNLGMIICIWTIGVALLKGSFSIKDTVRLIKVPGLVATIVAILLVLTGGNKYIPDFMNGILEAAGNATLPCAMIIAGAQIYNLGWKSMNFNKWNILLALTRLVIVPAILLVPALVLKHYSLVPDNMLIIFMIVNITPVSLNSVGLAIQFNSSADLAAEGVVFTHVFSILTISLYLPVIRYFFG